MATYNITVTTGNVEENGWHWYFSSLVIPQARGSGYTVGDVVTMSGGTFTTAMRFRVTAVSNDIESQVFGKVQTLIPESRGTGYTAFAASPTAVTGGTGTGLTLKLPAADIAALMAKTLDDVGKSYRDSWLSQRKELIGAALENATNTQMNNAASSLGVTLP